MTAVRKLQRDVFIDVIYEAACKDKDVIFVSCDLGAAALDRFREELPDQFLHTGISEQNMIDTVCGLAMAGKKVFCYAMACFLTSRCFEQIKCSLGILQQPVTLVGVGVGLGYDNAGPTHYSVEDIACLRTIPGMEVFSPADTEATASIASLCLENPALRYVRLERPYLSDVYRHGFQQAQKDGFGILRGEGSVALVSSGLMVHKCLDAAEELDSQGQKVAVIDLFRVKPINKKALCELLEKYDGIVTVEEQWLSGGMGSAVLEVMADVGLSKPVKRLGLPENFLFENGGRDYLHEKYGPNTKQILSAVRTFSL
ncbi:MAG: transketolase C-terminal domain-containing protein [Myxococcota bacterium]|nr:transketolase C-terminal domain-containing protein [Myxococcota bacterium]